VRRYRDQCRRTRRLKPSYLGLTSSISSPLAFTPTSNCAASSADGSITIAKTASAWTHRTRKNALTMREASHGDQRRAVTLSLLGKRCRFQTVNLALGFRLLRDRRVSLRAKLIALGIGAALTGVMELLQLPLEGVAAVFLPFIGAAGDLVLDGAEAVIGPVLIASVLLPHLAPADLVTQIRAETEGMAGRRA
jgi:hypothetical protein